MSVAYKRTLAAKSEKVAAHVVAIEGFLSHYLNGHLPYVRRHITAPPPPPLMDMCNVASNMDAFVHVVYSNYKCLNCHLTE